MMPFAIDRAQLLQHLRCSPSEIQLTEIADRCCALLQDCMVPRAVWRVFPIVRTAEGLSIGGLSIAGADLPAHLLGCTRVVVMAATLSASVDQAIRQAQAQDLTQAFVLDVAAGIAIEQLCDTVMQDIRAELGDAYYTERFSPGYGDLPIAMQGALLTCLQAQKQIGLTATAHHTLLPMKSVTAFVGISQQPVRDARPQTCGKDCASCSKAANCPYQSTDPVH